MKKDFLYRETVLKKALKRHMDYFYGTLYILVFHLHILIKNWKWNGEMLNRNTRNHIKLNSLKLCLEKQDK